MKKLLGSILAVALVFGLSISLIGCGGNKTSKSASSGSTSSSGSGGRQ